MTIKLKTWSDNISALIPKFKVSNKYIIMYTNFMMFVAIFGAIPLSIQCWKIYSTKKAGDISIFAFMFQVLISSLWIIYAILTGNGVIVISSFLIATVAVLIIILSYMYQ